MVLTAVHAQDHGVFKIATNGLTVYEHDQGGV